MSELFVSRAQMNRIFPIVVLIMAAFISLPDMAAGGLSRIGGSLGLGYEEFILELPTTTYQSRGFWETLNVNGEGYIKDPDLARLYGGVGLSNFNSKGGQRFLLGEDTLLYNYSLATTLTPKRKHPVTFFVNQATSQNPLSNSTLFNYGSRVTLNFPRLPTVTLRAEEFRQKGTSYWREFRNRERDISLGLMQGYTRGRFGSSIEWNDFLNEVDQSGYQRWHLALENSTNLGRSLIFYWYGQTTDRTLKGISGPFASVRNYVSTANLQYYPNADYNGQLTYTYSLDESGGGRGIGNTIASSINLRPLPLTIPELSLANFLSYANLILSPGGATTDTESAGFNFRYYKDLRPVRLDTFYYLSLQAIQMTPGGSGYGNGHSTGLELGRSFGGYSGSLGYVFSLQDVPLPARSQTIGHQGIMRLNGSLAGSIILSNTLIASRSETTVAGTAGGTQGVSLYTGLNGPRWNTTIFFGYSEPLPRVPGRYTTNYGFSLGLSPLLPWGLFVDIRLYGTPLALASWDIKAGANYSARKVSLTGYYQYRGWGLAGAPNHIVYMTATRSFQLFPWL